MRSVRRFFKPRSKPQLVPELVLLPLAVSVRHSTALTLGVLSVIAIAAVVRAWDARPARLDYWPAVLLLACASIVYRHGPYSLLAILLVAGLILFLLATAVSFEDAYSSLFAGLSLYLVVNVAAWIAGIESPSASVRIGGYDTTGAFLGERVFFPFSRAINESSFVAATLIVAVVAMIKLRFQPRWYLWLGAAAAVVVIIASNSRTPLLVVGLLSTAITLAPGAARAAAPYAVGATLLFPFIVSQLQPAIRRAGELIAATPYLARGQSVEEIAELGTRDTIWLRSVGYWLHYVDSPTRQLVGYGYYGHTQSGASAYYSSGISDFLTNRSALTMHNSVLQTLYDAGVLGAGILFLVAILAVYRYGRYPELLPMFAIVVVLGSSAVTEVSLAPGLSQTPFFLLLYVLVFIPVKVKPGRKSESPPWTETPQQHSPVHHGASAAYT